MTRSLGSRFAVGMVAILGLAAAACGSTTAFVTSFRPPKAEPLAMRGEKVAAVVMVREDDIRHKAETVLAREISKYGAEGVPMYTLSSTPAADNEIAARAAVERAGVKGIVVMRPIGKRSKTETHTTYTDPLYSSYWGGYYPYGWGHSYAFYPYGYYGSARGALVAGPPVVYGTGHTETYTETTTVLQVEVMVYSLKQNLLVFAGVSETTEADDVDDLEDFVEQLAEATVKELGAHNLISSK